MAEGQYAGEAQQEIERHRRQAQRRIRAPGQAAAPKLMAGQRQGEGRDWDGSVVEEASPGFPGRVPHSWMTDSP